MGFDSFGYHRDSVISLGEDHTGQVLNGNVFHGALITAHVGRTQGHRRLVPWRVSWFLDLVPPSHNATS